MTRYIIIVALGALSYGMLSSFAKIAYGQGYNAGEITFVQALIGAAVLWLIVLIKNFRSNKCKLKINWKVLLAGSTMGISAYAYYLSVEYIPASLAIVLLMQVTWMSVFAEWLFFKKRPSGVELVTILFIIGGTVLAGNLINAQSLNISTTGILLGLAASVLYTSYVLFTSKLGNDIPMFEKSALMTTGSALMILFINFKSITTSSHLDVGLLQWGSFLALFGTIIPPICFTKGMPKIGPAMSAILLTLELPAAVFCAHLILAEEVSLLQIVGIIIMFGSIIFLNRAKMKRAKSK
ncbi:EamA family transporter [Dysgonomonas capnocytophagoides]|uniref:EamA family transporter n=1 Tax=Dysgonomonas capnocytophagoides TaxID=45254 RepID=UPI00291F8BA7|nr:DMT family transporter [Dysgonomonas capnocytophagoides]